MGVEGAGFAWEAELFGGGFKIGSELLEWLVGGEATPDD